MKKAYNALEVSFQVVVIFFLNFSRLTRIFFGVETNQDVGFTIEKCIYVGRQTSAVPLNSPFAFFLELQGPKKRGYLAQLPKKLEGGVSLLDGFQLGILNFNWLQTLNP